MVSNAAFGQSTGRLTFARSSRSRQIWGELTSITISPTLDLALVNHSRGVSIGVFRLCVRDVVRLIDICVRMSRSGTSAKGNSCSDWWDARQDRSSFEVALVVRATTSYSAVVKVSRTPSHQGSR